MMQITDTILMIRPVHFRMNEQTRVNNYFQEDPGLEKKTINALAQQEFDAFVVLLESKGIHVIVVDDKTVPDTPDSIFPNNWISFHETGTVVLYPMFAENRRLERREDILPLIEDHGFHIKDIVDYTSAEKDQLFLEGTGSMVLDRVNRKAYCSCSPRAHEDLFIEFCEDFEYTPVLFTAYQSIARERLPIYHTNVMMCVAEDFAVVGLACIDDKKERKNLIHHLEEDGKEIVTLTEAQIHHFAGNMLQLMGEGEKRYTIMSEAAYRILTRTQVETLEKYGAIVYTSLHTIERCGGGSARCMMAEVFLPKRILISSQEKIS